MVGVGDVVHLGCALCVASLVYFSRPCSSSTQSYQISPGFQGSQMNWIDNGGLFLLSNSSIFAFGFITLSSQDATSFLLAVVHQGSSTVVWTANRASPVSHSDNFVFDREGEAYLQSGGDGGDGGGGSTVWSTNTSGMGGTSMELQDSGNLVLLGRNSSTPLWQSFDHPTDTVLSGQSFTQGMALVSKPRNNLSYRLEISSGDMMLYANFRQPQPYWSMQRENRKINNEASGGAIHSASLVSNSWNLYDQHGSLLGQFIVPADTGTNVTRAAVLGDDGFISFYGLLPNGGNGGAGGSSNPSSVRIPQDPCDTPQPCDPYFICHTGTRCQCPAVLSSDANCNPDIVAPCSPNTSFQLAKIEDGTGYFATNFLRPASRMNLTSCKGACMANCSCLALLFDQKSGDCFLFADIGSFRQADSNSTAYYNYVTYVKIANVGIGGGPGTGSATDGTETGHGKNSGVIVLVICLAAATVIGGLVYVAFRLQRKRQKKPLEPSQGDSSAEEDSFLESMSGMPVRFSYRDLLAATDDFSVKLGQGGFGSVYLGKLPDGTQVAVKKLEGIGQGRKEFRAEVSIIGSIHHVHLVKLRGFCAEGTHRLLAYEYMANGSLDRWIFRGNKGGLQLDWDKRYSIALGTAKGLAYLHEDCDAKIVHCDIKPENVLLDVNFLAKVSDFGLAKLMTREQSHAFTTLRGTRGYLAPEWITSYAISEKSDVYSFGMVLLEIVGGRKNYDPTENSEKAHFPSYAFKKMEEGRLEEVLDAKLKIDDKDDRLETLIKVALWCIQEDVSLRPSMTKIVQMLEGVAHVPQPPASYQMARLYANVFKSMSTEEGTSSGPSDYASDALLSAVRLSGPR